MFLRKGARKICSKLITIEHPCRSVILIKLLCNFVEIKLRHACSPVKTENKNQLTSAKAYSESNQTTNFERFAKIVNNFKPNYFYKTLHVRYLTGFWILLWVDILNENILNDSVVDYFGRTIEFWEIDKKLLIRLLLFSTIQLEH